MVGTRPEIIKTAILYKELSKDKRFKLNYCLTGQHKEMVLDFLELFEIKPDHELMTIEKSSDLNQKLSYLLLELGKYMKEVKPDLVMVQGDTVSCYAAALCAFNLGIDLAHVEGSAGGHAGHAAGGHAAGRTAEAAETGRKIARACC